MSLIYLRGGRFACVAALLSLLLSFVLLDAVGQTTNATSVAAAASIPTAPVLQPCDWDSMLDGFDHAPLGCLRKRAGLVSIDGADNPVAPPLPGCQTVQVGSVISALTPATNLVSINNLPGGGSFYPAGQYVCFQFLLDATTTVPIQAAFPPGVSGFLGTYLWYVSGGGVPFGFKVAEAVSPSNPLSTQFTNRNARIGVVIRTTTGAAGQPFNLGIGAPGGHDRDGQHFRQGFRWQSCSQ